MIDISDVEERLQKKNQILFTRESPCLQKLLQEIRIVNHRTLVKWAFVCAQGSVHVLKEKYPFEKRPEIALDCCQKWSRGEMKMKEAKRSLLDCHAVAKEITDQSDIALCHAIGQACATVHVETHAIGFPIYELSSIVFQYGLSNAKEKIEEKISYYLDTLQTCKKENLNEKWADFLLKEQPNKEMELWKKKNA